jgi:hypothetical protein
MRQGAAFIQRELPKVAMDDGLRSRTARLCDDLVGTGYDVVSELRDFDEPIQGRSREDVARMRVKRINQWLFEHLPALHEIVQALDAAARPGVGDKGAYILVAETAVGILNAYREVREAAEVIEAGNVRPEERGRAL